MLDSDIYAKYISHNMKKLLLKIALLSIGTAAYADPTETGLTNIIDAYIKDINGTTNRAWAILTIGQLGSEYEGAKTRGEIQSFWDAERDKKLAQCTQELFAPYCRPPMPSQNHSYIFLTTYNLTEDPLKTLVKKFQDNCWLERKEAFKTWREQHFKGQTPYQRFDQLAEDQNESYGLLGGIIFNSKKYMVDQTTLESQIKKYNLFRSRFITIQSIKQQLPQESQTYFDQLLKNPVLMRYELKRILMPMRKITLVVSNYSQTAAPTTEKGAFQDNLWKEKHASDFKNAVYVFDEQFAKKASVISTPGNNSQIQDDKDFNNFAKEWLQHTLETNDGNEELALAIVLRDMMFKDTKNKGHLCALKIIPITTEGMPVTKVGYDRDLNVIFLKDPHDLPDALIEFFQTVLLGCYQEDTAKLLSENITDSIQNNTCGMRYLDILTPPLPEDYEYGYYAVSPMSLGNKEMNALYASITGMDDNLYVTNANTTNISSEQHWKWLLLQLRWENIHVASKRLGFYFIPENPTDDPAIFIFPFADINMKRFVGLFQDDPNTKRNAIYKPYTGTEIEVFGRPNKIVEFVDDEEIEEAMSYRVQAWKFSPNTMDLWCLLQRRPNGKDLFIEPYTNTDDTHFIPQGYAEKVKQPYKPMH